MNKKILVTLAFIILITPILIVYRYSKSNVKGVSTEKEGTEIIRGIILPHHNFAKEILIDSYERLDRENYELIVIIGPNHFHPEIKEIVTSDNESGLEIQEHLLKELVGKANYMMINNEIVSKEHSIMLQTQYIEEFLPKAKILPIVVSPTTADENIENLADLLSEVSSNTLFIASVDFSHDLTYTESMENNEVSIQAIKSFDYSKINSFDDQYLDSSKSITLLLKIMENLDTEKFQVLHSTHGALIADDITFKGTSYVVGFFTE